MRPQKFTPPLITQLPFSRSCSIAPKTDPDRTRSNWSAISHCSPSSTSSTGPNTPPPVEKKRKRYRKLYPGEAEGITEEMRFVAMRLRNIRGKYTRKSTRRRGGSSCGSESGSDVESKDAMNGEKEEEEEEKEGHEGLLDEGGDETWNASVEGFVKYLSTASWSSIPSRESLMNGMMFLMPTSGKLDWSVQKVFQKILNGFRSRMLPYQNLPSQEFHTPSI